MFLHHDDTGASGGPAGPPRRDDPAGLTPVQRDLLWCLRRLASLRPLGQARDAHVHLLLQRRFGGGGMGLEHLLRCLVVGLARRATRAVLLHRPCHAALTEDEQRLLRALADAQHPARVAAVLGPMAGSRGGELAPILAGIAALLPPG